MKKIDTNRVHTVGLDLGKRFFQVHGVDDRGCLDDEARYTWFSLSFRKSRPVVVHCEARCKDRGRLARTT